MLNGSIVSLTVTANGTKIAYTVMPDTFTASGNPIGPAVIHVLDTATGRGASWTTSSPGQALGLSWAADGSHLAFGWDTSAAGSGIRMLATSASGDLLKASMLVWPQRWSRAAWGAGTLSSDGKTLYFAVPDRSHRNESQILAVPVSQGRRLGTWTAAPIAPLTTVPDGDHFVVFSDSGIYSLASKTMRGSTLSYRLPGADYWLLTW